MAVAIDNARFYSRKLRNKVVAKTFAIIPKSVEFANVFFRE